MALEPADQLEEEVSSEETETPVEDKDEAPEGREDTFFLPADYPGSEMLKAGDILQQRVVGRDSDGRLEVEHVPMKDPNAEPEYKQDLRRSMAAEPKRY